MENHKKLAHLLDVTQCVGCSACIVACAQTNYPDMLNAENTGWESLPANIRRVSAELARRPLNCLSNASSVRMRPASRSVRSAPTAMIRKRDR